MDRCPEEKMWSQVVKHVHDKKAIYLSYISRDLFSIVERQVCRPIRRLVGDEIRESIWEYVHREKGAE